MLLLYKKKQLLKRRRQLSGGGDEEDLLDLSRCVTKAQCFGWKEIMLKYEQNSKVKALVITLAVALGTSACGSNVAEIETSQSVIQASATSSDSKASAAEQTVDGQKANELSEEEGRQEAKEFSEEENRQENETEIPALRDCVEKEMGCRVGCAITGNEPWKAKLWDLVTTHFSDFGQC